MNRRRLRRTILQFDQEELTASVLSEIDRDPTFRRMLLRTTTVRQLVRMKQYEHPAPGTLEQCRAELRERIIRYEENLTASPDRTSAGEGFGWRYGLAAAFVALIGINVATSSRLPVLKSGLATPAAPSAEPGIDFMTAATNEYRLPEDWYTVDEMRWQSPIPQTSSGSGLHFVDY